MARFKPHYVVYGEKVAKSFADEKYDDAEEYALRLSKRSLCDISICHYKYSKDNPRVVKIIKRDKQ